MKSLLEKELNNVKKSKEDMKKGNKAKIKILKDLYKVVWKIDETMKHHTKHLGIIKENLQKPSNQNHKVENIINSRSTMFEKDMEHRAAERAEAKDSRIKE